MLNHILQTNSFESIIFEEAHGSWIWDTEGKKYLDLVSGMWCCNLGHSHPKIIQALTNQLKKLVHKNTRFLTPITLEATEKLLKFIPGNYEKITLLNSGSEAMEFAINFSKKVTKRELVLSLSDSYLGAYGLSKESSFTSTKGSKLRIDYPICDSEECDCVDNSTLQIEEIVSNYASELACFVFEPVMVSGGIFKPCTEWMNELLNRLKQKGVLIVVDEVTTGFGRTGTKFGYEHLAVKPDIIALGKALGNGYPVSAIITREDLESQIPQSARYYAQSHQLDPLGATAIDAVIDIFESENILEKSIATGTQIKKYLQSLSHPCIKEIRSYGMIFGIEIQDFNGKSSNEIIKQIKDNLLDEGVMIGLSLGKNLLRILPPLTISEEEISFFIEVFNKVLKAI